MEGKMKLEVDLFIRNLKHWQKETEKLRSILLKMDLEENFKWNLPCYSHDGSNIVIIQPFKACLGMMFFKGTLLKDPKKILVNNGPNSQAGRRFEFRSVKDITTLVSTIKAYIKEAVELEKSGRKVVRTKRAFTLPIELKKIFVQHPKFKKAFELLTPGRQRAYVLYFSGAKQSSTRQARIEKYMARILMGKGLTDR